MQTIRSAMKIVEKDFKSDKLQVLWTLIFTLYMLLVTGFAINSQFEDLNYILPYIDFLLFFFSPMMGFWFSKRTFRYINEDSYTQMLYYYRTLPIPLTAVVLSRIITGLTALVFNGVIYFGGIYVISNHIKAVMDIPSYLAFAGVWLGIGLMVTGFYMYWEFMVNGKAYFRNTLLFVLATSAAVIGMNLLGYSLFGFAVESAMHWKLLSPVMWGALMIGIITLILMSRRMLHLLKNSRDLA